MLEADVTRIIDGEDRFWQESFSFGNIPDAWIQYGGGEAFIEVDRGTEPVSVVEKKIDNYIRLKRTGSFGILFPGSTFRVLFITTTDERIEALQQVTKCYDVWFATVDEFLKEPLIHPHWFGLKGLHALPVAPKEKCKNCGKLSHRDVLYCWSCGYSFNKRICVSGHENPAWVHHCRTCGKDRSLMSRPHTSRGLSFSQHPTKPRTWVPKHTRLDHTLPRLAIAFGIVILVAIGFVILLSLL